MRVSTTTKSMLLNPLKMAAIALLALACSSTPKPAPYDLTTNAQSEVDALHTQLQTLENEKQVSVFAPEEYAGAKLYLDKTKDAIKDNAEQEKILARLGVAKSYIDKSATVADEVATNLLDVRAARQKAQEAGAARHYKSELADIDDDLVDYTEEGASETADIKLAVKKDLQKRYADLEVKSLKAEKLGGARTYLKAAKKLGAERVTPNVYKSVQEKIVSAEALIDTDRNNIALIDDTSAKATEDARKLVELTKTAVKSKEQTPEEIAMQIDKGTQVETLEGELAKKQALEAKMQRAQESFSRDEAEVYRQGDRVLIRVKDLRFKSGSANLPDTSLDLLGRVRSVVESFSPSAMVVEGHTDITGKKATNMRLSEERAEAVKKYLVSTNAIQDARVTTKGAGPDKPIKTNNTAEGRATNRRVDIILEPTAVY